MNEWNLIKQPNAMQPNPTGEHEGAASYRCGQGGQESPRHHQFAGQLRGHSPRRARGILQAEERQRQIPYYHFQRWVLEVQGQDRARKGTVDRA